MIHRMLESYDNKITVYSFSMFLNSENVYRTIGKEMATKEVESAPFR